MAHGMKKQQQPAPKEDPLSGEQCDAAVVALDRAMRAVGRADLTAREAQAWILAQHPQAAERDKAASESAAAADSE